jgi:hypothetical protein
VLLPINDNTGKSIFTELQIGPKDVCGVALTEDQIREIFVANTLIGPKQKNINTGVLHTVALMISRVTGGAMAGWLHGRDDIDADKKPLPFGVSVIVIDDNDPDLPNYNVPKGWKVTGTITHNGRYAEKTVATIG